MNAPDPTPERPRITPPRRGGIPPQLAGRRQWVAWQLVHKPSKNGKPWTKVPKNPRTGENASATDPRTWGTLAEALAAMARLGLDGVGYVFVAEDPYVGVDLDGCRDRETGTITPAAEAVLRRLDTYAEPSVTGTGLHLIAEAALPGDGRGKKRGDVEAYGSGRFFAFTGRPLAGYDAIEERHDELAAWHREAFGDPEPAPKAGRTGGAPTAPPASVRTILDRVLRTAKGRRLHEDGDVSGYPSQSEADLGLCDLYVLFGADRDQADELFRASALFRPKWDERRGTGTYGDWTLDRAFDGSVRAADAPPPPPPDPDPAGAEDANDAASGENDEAERINVNALLSQLDVLERRVVELEEENTRLWAENRRLREVESGKLAVLRNKHLRSERLTAVAVVNELAAAEHRPTGTDGSGFTRVWLATVAENIGCSPQKVSRDIARLAEWGIVEKQVRRATVDADPDPETGEILTRNRSELHLRLLAPPKETLAKLAVLEPPRPEGDKGWGGDRVCREHPDAGVIVTTTVCCAECGKELGRQTKRLAPPAGTEDVRVDDPAGEEAADQMADAEAWAAGDDAPVADDGLDRQDDGLKNPVDTGGWTTNLNVQPPPASGPSLFDALLANDPPPPRRPGGVRLTALMPKATPRDDGECIEAECHNRRAGLYYCAEHGGAPTDHITPERSP